jgi:signal transduction histidine kinase
MTGSEDALSSLSTVASRGQYVTATRYLRGAPSADGGTRYIARSGAPLLGYRGIATDATEERSRQECEVRQQRMAAVGQLAGSMAHEINNLLHPIINLSRRVASALPSEDEKRQFLNTVIDAGVRASEIVASLLTTVRPGVEESDILSLGEALQRVCHSIRPMIPDAIRFEVAIIDGGRAHVRAGELLQVLSNLIANSIYATAGRGKISVDLIPDRTRGYVLTVSDDGKGMDEATRKRALEPFFTTKEVGQGTGLGLSIVHGMVRAWGGTIGIESGLGRGARVVIRVPVTRVEACQSDHAGEVRV